MTGVRKSTEDTGAEKAIKGNKPKWTPAQRIGKLEVPEGHVGRWCDNDPANLQKKKAEGWEIVNKVTSPGSYHKKDDPDNISDGSGINGAITYRELVGMALPNDLKEARDEYYRNETIQMTQTRVNMDNAKEKLGGAGNIKTKIVID